uniref:Uncharacterized protein n=1 Tax=Macrostomum lignano TaxID=282301 RepID=A0A1I8FFC0_9PLAT
MVGLLTLELRLTQPWAATASDDLLIQDQLVSMQQQQQQHSARLPREDLLDLFPGVSQPAFVCVNLLSRLPVPTGLQFPALARLCNSSSNSRVNRISWCPTSRSPVTDRLRRPTLLPRLLPTEIPLPQRHPQQLGFHSLPHVGAQLHSPGFDLAASHDRRCPRPISTCYSLQPQLAEWWLSLRRQALVLWRYLFPATFYRGRLYDSRLTLHLYSAADLCAVRAGELRTRLAKAGHVTACRQLFAPSRPGCWICRREDRPILLPRAGSVRRVRVAELRLASGTPTAAEVPVVAAAAARCPRCDTLQRLAIDSLRFDLSDD